MISSHFSPSLDRSVISSVSIESFRAESMDAAAFWLWQLMQY
jgi:hypothetical protein